MQQLRTLRAVKLEFSNEMYCIPAQELLKLFGLNAQRFNVYIELFCFVNCIASLVFVTSLGKNIYIYLYDRSTIMAMYVDSVQLVDRDTGVHVARCYIQFLFKHIHVDHRITASDTLHYSRGPVLSVL